MKQNTDNGEESAHPVDSWIEDIVIPILDEFIDAFDGILMDCGTWLREWFEWFRLKSFFPC